MIFKKGVLYECIISTKNEDSSYNLAPFGVYIFKNNVFLKMYKWSRTLKNVLRSRIFVINFVQDGILFLKVLAKEFNDIETFPSENFKLPVIKNCNAYLECIMEEAKEYKDFYFIKGKILSEKIFNKNFINRGNYMCIEIAIKLTRRNFNIEKELSIIRKTMDYNSFLQIKNYISKIVKNR